MTANEMQAELARLRARVRELDSRKAGGHRQSQDNGEQAEKPSSKRAQSDAGDHSLHGLFHEAEISSHRQELVDVLEEEIKDTRPMTLLVVFALGILIGRLLPR